MDNSLLFFKNDYGDREKSCYRNIGLRIFFWKIISIIGDLALSKMIYLWNSDVSNEPHSPSPPVGDLVSWLPQIMDIS